MNIVCRHRIRFVFCCLFFYLHSGQATAYEDPAQTASVPRPGAINSLLVDLKVVGNSLVAVGERGHVLVADRQGKAWRQAQVPTQRLLTAIAFTDEKNGWAVGHDHIILHTLDGGINWEMQWQNVANDLPAPLLGVNFVTTQHGWAVGAYGVVLETEDGGKSWNNIKQRIDNPDEWHNYAVASRSNGLVYICGESGTSYRSDDAGRSWVKLNIPYDGSLFGVLALSDHEVILHGLRGTVLYSSDKGDSWQKIDIASEAGVLGASQIDNNSVAFTGSNGLISILTLKTMKTTTHIQKDRISFSNIVALGPDHLGMVGLNGFQTVEY